MKTLWLLGLMSLLSIVAYNKVAGGASDGAQSPGRPGAAPEPVFMGSDGALPVSLSYYVFLHRTRQESIPVHVAAGVKACPE